MAVIEDYDDDDSSEHKHELRRAEVMDRDTTRPDEQMPLDKLASVQAYAAQTPSLDRLVKGKGRMSESQIADMLASATPSQEILLADLCTCTKAFLDSETTERLDIDRLERTTDLFRAFKRCRDDLSGSPDGLQDALLRSIYSALQIPCEFLVEDYNMTSNTTQVQSFWRVASASLLALLEVLLDLPIFVAAMQSSTASLSECLIAVSRFLPPPSRHLSDHGEDTGDEIESWTTPLSSSTAARLLEQLFSRSSIPLKILAQYILLEHLKPLFSSTPHPSLHPSTARRLDRPLGGDLYSGTADSSALWKGKTQQSADVGGVGSWQVLRFVVERLCGENSGDVEELWPALVPPLLTLLDDHEVRYRYRGIRCVRSFLDICSAKLLLRTGLGDLIQKSLTTTYSFTSSSKNASTIRLAVHTHMHLINLLYPNSSVPASVCTPAFPVLRTTGSGGTRKPAESPALTRFNALCTIYRQAVINIFAFQSSSIPFLTLAFSLMPPLADELGAGVIRYLSDTLPVLCQSLGGSKAQRELGSLLLTKETVQMHRQACAALRGIVRVCEETNRMERWRGMVIASLGTLWCHLVELEEAKRKRLQVEQLEQEMRGVVAALQDNGAEKAQKDVQRVLALDPILFAGLCRTQGDDSRVV